MVIGLSLLRATGGLLGHELQVPVGLVEVRASWLGQP